jgi:phosphate transport system permease protein
LNGVPSIVIGIFAYGIAVLPFRHFSALAGGIALGIMMIPIVARTTEDFCCLSPERCAKARWHSAPRGRGRSSA